MEQCAALQAFLRKPCLDPAASADFAALTAGEGYSLVVSSQLRRAACTIAIALSDRLRRSREAIFVHSSLQEISRNFDTLALAPSSCAPRLDAVVTHAGLEPSPCHDVFTAKTGVRVPFGAARAVRAWGTLRG